MMLISSWVMGKGAVPHRELVHVPLQHTLQVQLLELPLQSGGQARVHGGPPGQHDVFVELGPVRRRRTRSEPGIQLHDDSRRRVT